MCLALDVSGSICGGTSGELCTGCPNDNICREPSVSLSSCCDNFANVIQLATVIVNSLGDLPVSKSFSVVKYGTEAELVSNVSSTADTLSTIGQLLYSGGLDDYASGIAMCRQSLEYGQSQVPASKKFILLITDGVMNATEISDNVTTSAQLAAASAKSNGIIIIPVIVPPDLTVMSDEEIYELSGLSSNGDVYDFRDYNVSKVLQLKESLFAQVSC